MCSQLKKGSLCVRLKVGETECIWRSKALPLLPEGSQQERLISLEKRREFVPILPPPRVVWSGIMELFMFRLIFLWDGSSSW